MLDVIERKDKSIQVCYRFNKTLKDRIGRIAKKTNRTESDVVRQLLELAIESVLKATKHDQSE